MNQDHNAHDEPFDLRRRAELAAATNPSGIADVSALSPEETRRTIHELQVLQIELEIQNEELRQTQRQLEASRDKYAEFYDFAPVGFFSLDPNGKILEANLAGADLLGLQQCLLTDRPLAEFVAKEDGDALYLHFREVFETRSKRTCNIRLTAKDGNQVRVRLDTVAIMGSDESVSGFSLLCNRHHHRKSGPARIRGE